MLGGGMRQAGILAAAGIVALETMVDRLAEDHARAKVLANRLTQLPHIEFEMGLPQTNMVFPSISKNLQIDAPELVKRLKEKGILAGSVGPYRLRLVTHYGIEDNDIDMTVEAISQTISKIQ
jgi:threonine aldolase